ncbi:MICOS complex subunit MIC60 [Sphingobium sp. BYY-5]|uniref:MICOS complex subunit MIC60 n=1 Tax=Sphingobium sp. BYY-5 TaxID=2926400 RepID=UPI001FA6AB0D|nr:MICOS complex subunit MIC60 [Sphingobium sp. BYY-5]MCI4590643.1 MICOS complex subunit MIC60 [Sphingobium sp. BYY-5]
MIDDRVSMNDGDGVASAPVTPPPARRRNILPLLILTLLAFALGVALTAWAWPQIQRRWGDPQRPSAALPAGVLPGVATRPLTADAAQMLDSRVVQLEERLTRITVEAQAASANAARAEGLLVAFAARRALDNGAPLGYIEGQLRLRFGQAQPRAVATIINAAREPVTLTDLRAGLSDIGNQVTTPPADASWWDALRHEAHELITIHDASTPSPRPQAAYDRALRYLDGGRVSAALAEVEHMPGRTVAERWVQMARRYMEARRALDLIETAAILEPRTLRTTEGEPVAQTSPLAP